MGLDQYLYARKYVADYDFVGKEAMAEFAKVKEATGMTQVSSPDEFGYSTVGKSGSVSICAAYWRKANSIHGWFVRNCSPDGEDDCREMYVPRERLVELKDLCERVMLSKDDHEKAKELLPPTEGFFFGTYEIDDWYWQDVQSTIDQLNSVLGWFPDDQAFVSFYYQASW